MSKSEIRLPVLSAQEISALDITFSEVLGYVEHSFRAHGEGKYENPPKPGIHPRDKSFIHAMPACVMKEPETAGIKWVSGYTSNRDKGLPTIVGLIILNDPDTGLPLALMDGTWITNVRTACATGVSAKYMLRGDETSLSVIGAGIQGLYNTLVLSLVMPRLEKIVIHDPWAPSIDRFKKEIGAKLPNLKIEVVDTVELAARGAEVVIWAVPPQGKELRPFNSDWLQKGATLFSISNSGMERDVLKKRKLITDDWEQYCSFFKDYYDIPDKPYAQTGEIVTGQKKARDSPDEIIIVANLGLGIHDVTVARQVLLKARERGHLKEIVMDEDCQTPAPIPRLQ